MKIDTSLKTGLKTVLRWKPEREMAPHFFFRVICSLCRQVIEELYFRSSRYIDCKYSWGMGRVGYKLMKCSSFVNKEIKEDNFVVLIHVMLLIFSCNVCVRVCWVIFFQAAKNTQD